MFSSFVSFLPSFNPLTSSEQQPQQFKQDFQTDDDEPDPDSTQQPQQEQQQGDEQPTQKSKDKPANEVNPFQSILRSQFYLLEQTFIFVRPPPSKSNHPLNLQVQLVPPNGRPPSGVTPTGDSFAGGAVTPTSASTTGRKSTDGASLARTSSDRSDASYPVNYGSSTASFASVASTSTSASNRRTIIPLYNLQAHNVMTNVIVDVGTDPKIAKF